MLRYTLIITSLLSGLFLYLGFRATNTPIYRWVKDLGFENEISYLRTTLQDVYLPDWFIYSMPDGLWMFAFVLTVLSIWNYKLDKISGVWIVSAILCGLGFEIMQKFIKGMGVFDWTDLFIMLLGVIMALRFFTNKQIPEEQLGFNKS